MRIFKTLQNSKTVYTTLSIYTRIHNYKILHNITQLFQNRYDILQNAFHHSTHTLGNSTQLPHNLYTTLLFCLKKNFVYTSLPHIYIYTSAAFYKILQTINTTFATCYNTLQHLTTLHTTFTQLYITLPKLQNQQNFCKNVNTIQQLYATSHDFTQFLKKKAKNFTRFNKTFQKRTKALHTLTQHSTT